MGFPAVIAIVNIARSSTSQIVLYSPWHILVAFFAGSVISFYGNNASIKALNQAPNPGYSLIVQKGYASFTLFSSVFFFGSSLYLSDVVAAVVTFYGIFLVLVKNTRKIFTKTEVKNVTIAEIDAETQIDVEEEATILTKLGSATDKEERVVAVVRKSSEVGIKTGIRIRGVARVKSLVSVVKYGISYYLISENSWIANTLIAYIMFGTLTIIARFLVNEGMSVDLYLAIMLGSSAIMNLITVMKVRLINANSENNTSSNELHSKIKLISLLLLAGIFSYLFNYFKTLSTVLAPNIGYADIFNASSIVALTIVYRIFFNDALDKQSVLGIILTFIGLLTLVVFSNF